MRQLLRFSSLWIAIVLLFLSPYTYAHFLLEPRTTASSLSSASSALGGVPTTSSFSLPSTTTTTSPESQITEPPNPSDLALGLQMKWHVTTYWSCVTLGTYTHCGWHEPVVPGGDEIAAAPKLNRDIKRAGCVAGAALIVGALIV